MTDVSIAKSFMHLSGDERRQYFRDASARHRAKYRANDQGRFYDETISGILPTKTEVLNSRPTAEMLVAAYLRGIVPRSLTAQLMNDPPPGYSALDEKLRSVHIGR